MPGSGKQLCEVLKLLPSSVDVVDFTRRWHVSNLELPAFARSTVDGGCKGVVVNGGLYTQCRGKVCKDGFCRKCINSFVEEGMPRLGLWSERLEKGWTTTDGRRPLSFAQYLKKREVSLDDGKEFLREKGVEMDKIPEWEWLEKTSRKTRGGAGTDDTDDEGESKVKGKRVTNRQLPIEGKKKSPNNENAHRGKNGSFLRVRVHKETHVVEKIKVDNWTSEGNAKFAELYCEGREGEDVGKDYNIRKSSSKKSAAQNQLAELEEKNKTIAELQAKLAAAMNSSIENDVETKKTDEEIERKCELVKQIRKLDPGYSGGEIGENESDIIAQMEQTLKDLREKKRKEEELAKRRAEKKAKLAAAKKAKAEEAKKKAEEEKQKLMAQLEALKAQTENDGEDDDLTFEDSDDEEDEAEFNPFEWNGVTYHRTDEDHLYTEDGDFWGHVNANGEGVEGDEGDEE